jgi:hypothetical protein
MQINWDVLSLRDCLDILIGDVEVEIGAEWEYTPNKYSMPYLSGPQICSLGKMFGFNLSYSTPQQSRWSYMDEVIIYCISNNKMQHLLKFLFGLERFKSMLMNLDSPEEINIRHELILSKIVDKINSILIYNEYKLNIVDGYFAITKEGQLPIVDSPVVERINNEYINSIRERCITDIGSGSYDSAVTKSRTLIEEVLCHIIEENQQEPSTSGRLSDLYTQVKNIYDLHQRREVDRRINGLLKGLEKIITAITEMSNNGSDRHGVGSRRYELEEHHVRLIVNSSITFVEFIFAIHGKKFIIKEGD